MDAERFLPENQKAKGKNQKAKIPPLTPNP
jgi:hypothetical protein